jgi:hypothetical protein
LYIENYALAKAQGKAITLDRLVLRAVSVQHLAHWRDKVVVTRGGLVSPRFHRLCLVIHSLSLFVGYGTMALHQYCWSNGPDRDARHPYGETDFPELSTKVK